MNCVLCGGDAHMVSTIDRHHLCEERRKLGLPTPSLGRSCVACKGHGYLPRSAAGPMLDFSLGPGRIRRAIAAWAPKCEACGGKGYTTEEQDG